MCKYCEDLERVDELYCQYYSDCDHYIAYNNKNDRHELWSGDDSYYSVIKFCPWCGRKLGAPKEQLKPEVTITKDDFDLLLKKYDELKTDHDKLRKQVANLWRVLLDHYKYQQKCGYNIDELNRFVHQFEKLM